MIQANAHTVTGAPKHARDFAVNPLLTISGLVRTPAQLTPAEISALPHRPFAGATATHDHCNVPANKWAGVRITDVLAMTGLHEGGRFVLISGGPFGTPIAIAALGDVLLCDQLDGAEITVEQGGPWRLVVPGQQYCASVKWVDSLLVTAELPDDSGSRIVAARRRTQGTGR